MPNLPFDFNVQNNFPQADVIQAAQENANRQLLAQQQGQQSLIEGLKSIGQVGQTLLERRRAMAQAMAGAQYIAAKNPKLFQPTQTTTQAPVAANQTAAYNPDTGTVTPNTGTAGAVTTRPQTTTTPPLMDLNTMATALIGTPFNDVLKTDFDQHRLDIDTALKNKELEIQAQNYAATQALQRTLAGFTGLKTGSEIQHTQNQEINDLLERRQQAAANLPTGWWNSINNDKAEQAKQTIADIDAKLAAKGYKGLISSSSGSANPTSQSLVTPSGTRFTVNP